MAQLRLGLIGLGALGSRIATRLLRTGFSLEIYDIADVALRMFNMDVGGIVTLAEDDGAVLRYHHHRAAVGGRGA
jgi:3-hydroxyisobutyrate dehydrogenase-like beta-hydroxyacid dehydrogenase